MHLAGRANRKRSMKRTLLLLLRIIGLHSKKLKAFNRSESILKSTALGKNIFCF